VQHIVIKHIETNLQHELITAYNPYSCTWILQDSITAN